MPNISASEYKRLQAADAELQALRNREVQRPYVHAALQNLGMLLACTPWEEWPAVAKAAYQAAARNYPVPAQLYRAALPH